jgi:hypothetical protein
MLFPKNRMRFTTSHQGKTEPEGWIVLDFKGFDLEGVTTLTISLADIEQLKQGGDTTANRLKQARSLLGGEMETEEG